MFCLNASRCFYIAAIRANRAQVKENYQLHLLSTTFLSPHSSNNVLTGLFFLIVSPLCNCAEVKSRLTEKAEHDTCYL